MVSTLGVAPSTQGSSGLRSTVELNGITGQRGGNRTHIIHAPKASAMPLGDTLTYGTGGRVRTASDSVGSCCAPKRHRYIC